MVVGVRIIGREIMIGYGDVDYESKHLIAPHLASCSLSPAAQSPSPSPSPSPLLLTDFTVHLYNLNRLL